MHKLLTVEELIRPTLRPNGVIVEFINEITTWETGGILSTA